MAAEQYWNMFEAQNRGCAICGEIPEGRHLAVDEDHSDGMRIRGLLCKNHNLGLGLFSDSPELLRKAASYLEAR